MTPSTNSLEYRRTSSLSSFWPTLSTLGLGISDSDEGEVKEMHSNMEAGVVDQQPSPSCMELSPLPSPLLATTSTTPPIKSYLSWLYSSLLAYTVSPLPSTTTATDVNNQTKHQLKSPFEEIDGPNKEENVSGPLVDEHQPDDWLTAVDTCEEIIVLDGQSHIITNEEARKVANHLPYRYRAITWKPLYSTYYDGMSLQTLYRKCGQATHVTANILLVKDDLKNVIGAFTTDSWQLKSTYRHTGKGHSFLFNMKPTFKLHKWTGQNEYFMMAEKSCLHMGLSNGRYGLWIDDSLTLGHADDCKTFSEGPLSDRSYFKISGIEVWGV